MHAAHPAVLLLLPCFAVAQAVPGLADRLDEQFRRAFPPNEPGAAVLVAKGGEVVFRKGYGLASVELGVPVDPANAFCFASLTKPFTAAAVLALVDDGKLALADPASRYLPDLEIDPRVTIEHLLGHGSGIPDFSTDPGWERDLHAEISPEELCAAAKARPLSFEPGSQFAYANVNYALLARIVAVVSGLPWERYLAERIFAPAGMTDTRYGGHDRIVPRLVTGYTNGPDGWRRSRALSLSRGYGLGGLCGTVDDLARFCAALDGGALLKPETIARMQTPRTLADGEASPYALGWYVRDVRGRRFVFHGGAIFGWRAMLARIPADGVVCAVLTNRDRDDNEVARLATGAAALVAGQ